MTWEQILSYLPIITAFLAAIPGAYAIRRQLKMEELDKKKAMKEAEDISANIVSKYVDAAGNLQDFYTELMEEVKGQFDECKLLVSRMEEKIDVLTEENRILREKVEELEKGIEVLTKQIVELGAEPRYRRRK